jgi:hypothetical protein
MELTSQVASLEDEVKLLKGEIKAVLKEIRAAVLGGDNPFGPNAASLRSATPTELRVSTLLIEPQQARAGDAQATEVGPAETFPKAVERLSLEQERPHEVLPRPSAAPSPSAQPIAEPEEAPRTGYAPPFPTPESYPAPRSPEPFPLGDERRAAAPEVPEQRASLLTIASLLAWVEDALSSLGPRRFRLMIELAYFSELLSPEVRDVLCELAQLWPASADPEQPASVNECLLVLRQLEAILNGEKITRLPRRRGARRRA